MHGPVTKCVAFMEICALKKSQEGAFYKSHVMWAVYNILWMLPILGADFNFKIISPSIVNVSGT
jgi:hypothetical protein